MSVLNRLKISRPFLNQLVKNEGTICKTTKRGKLIIALSTPGVPGWYARKEGVGLIVLCAFISMSYPMYLVMDMAKAMEARKG